MRSLILLLFAFNAHAEKLWMTFDGQSFDQIEESELNSMANSAHKTNLYCGGFAVFPDKPSLSKSALNINSYTVNREKLVKKLLDRVQERKLFNYIKKFSSYRTRYYTSAEGVKAAKDLGRDWRKLSSKRRDIEVKLFDHKKWPQPSVILKIKGSTNKNIIVGGHLDSINTDDEGNHSHAPGADDNASGISVLTEILRVLVASNYKPKNNILIIGYAAEEVGLRGSFEIAERFLNQKKVVKGVLQIDGANYNGSTKKIVLINDYTDSEQNNFLGKLIDRYVKVPWGYDTCGYACSDHYPWTYNGFVASFPAEAYIKEENPYIHTAKDTIEVLKNRADHSVHFAKLALAYIIELDK